MSNADYMYYIIPDMENGVNGGVVRVEFPTKENPKVKIIAEAMVFPVLNCAGIGWIEFNFITNH